MFYGSLDATKTLRPLRKYYSADGSMEIKQDIGTGAIEFITYIGGDGYTAPVAVKSNGVTQSFLYLHRDYQGSILAITDDAGTVLEKRQFDAWGSLIQLEQNGVLTPLPSGGAGGVLKLLLDRGYTGHEHLQSVGLINMNGRLYDPKLHRFLQPDNYVQDPTNTQNYNRYGYCWNNPLKYSDPDGEFIWAPIIIGAVFGAYSGGTLANNGELNPTKWDYSSGKTWGYVLGGAIVGGISGGVANNIATSGVAFANTQTIIAGSLINSAGTFMYTGGQTDLSVSFGVGSFNFSTGEFGYLGKNGNSFMENLGYGLGAVANISDALAGTKPGTVELRTENDPNYSKMLDKNGNPILIKDLIGHSQLSDGKGNVLVDWGPAPGTGGVSGFGDWVEGTNSYENGSLIPITKMQSNPITISGVNTSTINKFSAHLNQGGKYNLALNSCVTQTSRALNMAGVFNIGIHPYILQAQMYFRSVGVRPILYSYHLTNK
jgi:RHS repeat-associated protein